MKPHKSRMPSQSGASRKGAPQSQSGASAAIMEDWQVYLEPSQPYLWFDHDDRGPTIRLLYGDRDEQLSPAAFAKTPPSIYRGTLVELQDARAPYCSKSVLIYEGVRVREQGHVLEDVPAALAEPQGNVIVERPFFLEPLPRPDAYQLVDPTTRQTEGIAAIQSAALSIALRASQPPGAWVCQWNPLLNKWEPRRRM